MGEKKPEQGRAPVLEALEAYHRLDRYGFTPPGHRQGRGTDARTVEALGRDTFRSDVLATAGLDDRRATGRVLSEAEELMAAAVDAERAFFSTCGSSLSVKAAMLAVTRGQGEILIGRDAHKSVTAGLLFSGLRPRWIPPRYDEDLHLAHPPSPESVEQMWQRHPDAAAALIVSPTPYGTCADLEAIAEICHSRGRPLIVDEAWGAHLPFHDGLPTWAMSAGADICVVSVHKMGMGFEQGSVYHLQGSLVDPVRLQQCADLLASTSPNVMLYAGIDGWRRQMALHGHGLLEQTIQLARRLRSEIDSMPGLHVLHDELLHAEASHDLDPLHLLIDVTGLGISGYQASDWLRAEQRIDMGLVDHRRVEAVITTADDDASARRLLGAFQRLAQAAPTLPTPPPVRLPRGSDFAPEMVLQPREAFFGPVEAVPAAEAAGRIAAEQIIPYPPGIPAILPGERINGAVLEYLRSGLAAGMYVPDPADPALETVRVVPE
jgi:arginine/lysine/ornithine decarboxylase